AGLHVFKDRQGIPDFTVRRMNGEITLRQQLGNIVTSPSESDVRLDPQAAGFLAKGFQIRPVTTEQEVQSVSFSRQFGDTFKYEADVLVAVGAARHDGERHVIAKAEFF